MILENIYAFDFFLLDFIADNFHSAPLDAFMAFFTYAGNGGLVWLVIAAILLVRKETRSAGIVLLIGLAVMLLTGNVLLKSIINRPRPFVIRGITPVIGIPAGSSFPSGHTYSSFTAAAIISRRFKRAALPAYIAAGIIGFSRLYFYVHFPTDVIAGAVLGTVLGNAVWYVYCKAAAG